MKTFNFAFLTISAMVLLGSTVGAQPHTTGQQLEGSWLVDVSPDTPPGVPPLASFKALFTYTHDGIVIENDVTSPPAVGPLAGSVTSSGHGEWARIGDRQFTVTTIKLAYANSKLVATLRATGTLTLNDTLAGYTSTFKGEFRDPNGNLILATTGTTQGVRIGVDIPQ